jgi:hypothetical protein
VGLDKLPGGNLRILLINFNPEAGKSSLLAVGATGGFAGSQAGTGAGGATATGATVALVFFPL